jgi:hypothetical protein
MANMADELAHSDWLAERPDPEDPDYDISLEMSDRPARRDIGRPPF